jgi:fermentation-respiration switch protein FrsA (DUF1100 family)
MGFVRRRGGTVATAAAVVGFAVGATGAYQVMRTQPPAQILLRQATEGDPMASFDETPGAGGVLVLMRNDGTTPVEVTDAAFARTSAAPPLYIAPETVPPGGEVNVYVPVPGTCFISLSITGAPVPPVRILVSAQQPGGPVESVPVEVVGQLAEIMAACHQGNSR